MKLSLFSLFSALVGSCLLAQADEINTLSEAEKQGGWRLLFDGKSNAGWRAIGKAEFPTKGWVIRDGILSHEARAGGGDIVTAEQFDDFELAWEWRIAPGGNSGLKYNLLAPEKAVGCEYQLIDDAKNPDANQREGARKTGGLYDVLPPAAQASTKPPGEWNHSRIVVRGPHVEHWLNGTKSVVFDFGSEALKAAVMQSKFKSNPGWSEKRKSPILLQDHGDAIDFRNMKIRS